MRFTEQWSRVLSLRIEPLVGNFGVEVRNIDVPRLADADLKHLLLWLYDQRFVVLRSGGLTKAQFVEFARRVGEPIRLSGDPEYPEIARITNIDRVDDLIMCDNPTTMHSATPMAATTGPDDTRLLHRISLRGNPSVFCQPVEGDGK